MSIDSGKFSQENKKKIEKTKKEKKQDYLRVLENEKRKKEIKKQEEAEKVLDKLEEMLDDGNLSVEDISTIKNIVEKSDINEEDVNKMLEKIEEIEEIEDIDNYLPSKFRITAEDYRQSLTDSIKRLQTITKLNTGLTLLAQHISSKTSIRINLFSGYLAVLDKNLIKIQENTIDVKDSLVKLDKKGKSTKKISFLEKLKILLREFFN